MVALSLFDSQFYLKHNPDVAAAVQQGWITAVEHFQQYGMAEGRSPFSLFNAEYYLAMNPDVAQAVSTGAASVVQHFMSFGANETRDFSPLFDVQAYLDANPDVREAVQQGQISATQHFLQHGVAEARDLGNGVNLSDFAQDPIFSTAIASGNLQAAVERLGDVIPFLPTFIAPTGWQVIPIHALAGQDFVLPAWLGPGITGMIQNLQTKILESGLLDPSNLNPDGTGLKDPTALINLVWEELYGTSPIDIIGVLPPGVDIPGFPGT